MKIKSLLLFIFLIISSHAQAACYLRDGSSPQTLTLPSQTIFIDADAPVDTALPVYVMQTPPLGQLVTWDNCPTGLEVGRDVYNLIGLDAVTHTYATNVSGIRVKPLYSNGVGEGFFPRTQNYNCILDGKPTSLCTLSVAAQSYFKMEFYKTSDKLSLNNKDGDVVLPAALTLYYWIEFNAPSNHTLKLYMNEVKIVSTPVCQVSDGINIDYGLVTSRTLTSAGIAKDLDFHINCKTDYGTYSASAYINTDTPAPDSSYIRVEDASGSRETLGIKIKNSKGNDMLLNTPQSSEIRSGNNSESAAVFNWKAILFPISSTKSPANGVFRATAHITFNIN
ncbi:fimbrial protein [Pantoea sp.]|uniref:fimbrial protein n=1 Tax=Pantoea sp. TaxID=69393 RepID=UPI00289D5223|nr:fimbrial protein [Pantoea sp.]